MDTEQESGFDPATRRLCPDGACIGVLDASGKCSECGQVFGPAANGRAADPVSFGGTPAVDTERPPSDFDPDRRLCDDGACVGVIGENGACTVCGRMAG